MTCPVAVQCLKLSLYHLSAHVAGRCQSVLHAGPETFERKGAVRLIEESVSRALILLMVGSGIVVSKANITPSS